MNPTIILADDHPLLLNGMEEFLKKLRFNIVATSRDGHAAYNSIVNHSPTIAILDFDMPKSNGLEVAKLCAQNQLNTKIIILTLYKQASISREIGNTIHGYVLKNDALSEIQACIEEVQSGSTYMSKNLEENVHIVDANSSIDLLTTSEKKILRYLAKNQSSSQIAESLFVSKRTVEKHRSNIIKKLEIPPTQNGLLLWVQKHPHLFNT